MFFFTYPTGVGSGVGSGWVLGVGNQGVGVGNVFEILGLGGR